MTVTGHATRSMFDRYNIVSPTEKQEAARRIGAASEEAARRATAGAPAVVALVPRLAPTQGTTRVSVARRDTVVGEAISAEVQQTAAIS